VEENPLENRLNLEKKKLDARATLEALEKG